MGDLAEGDMIGEGRASASVDDPRRASGKTQANSGTRVDRASLSVDRKYHLLAAHLSTDAKVGHIAAPDQPSDWRGHYVLTLCGRVGRWSATSPRGGICKRCTARTRALRPNSAHETSASTGGT